ncbi:glycosyltransferase family 1 protein [Methanorbis rubei]|uniref:D-inositol-3-phosphate glycosyltransferase n=1 Tax=Methanorbis rubei TaxID=3028300 RepID=A0AAE4MGA7_9EURY|nr:D-inositol-3-phosphate glycosyltransferase [Methanocorpusculaceae archaeon Cs1]
MRVLYDHQAFRLGKYAGIPRYFTELISRYQSGNQITPIIPDMWSVTQDYRKLQHCPENITWNIRDKIVTLSLQMFHQNPSRLLDGAEYKTRKLLQKQDFDVFHPTWLESYFLKDIGKKPYVLTIHDLTCEKYPENTPKAVKFIKYTSEIIDDASRFIAISKSTKNDLVGYYDVDPELIDIVYHGSLFEKYLIPKRTDVSACHESRYLLYVGIRYPHKNFLHFVLSISSILRDGCKLICAGGGTFSQSEMDLFSTLGVSRQISQITVNDEQLISLYQNAIAFVYPSLNEGFGLPLLEAFSCGCPVLCSNTSSLPEIGGNAVLYFDPKNPVEISNAVYSVMDDERLIEHMISNGYNQLSEFSWDKCARDTMNVYQKTME